MELEWRQQQKRREAQRSERSSSEFVARVLHPSNGKSLNLASLGVAHSSTFACVRTFSIRKQWCSVRRARTIASARKPRIKAARIDCTPSPELHACATYRSYSFP